MSKKTLELSDEALDFVWGIVKPNKQISFSSDIIRAVLEIRDSMILRFPEKYSEKEQVKE